MGANPGARAILFSPQSRRDDIPVAQATHPLPDSCVEPHPPLRFRQNLILNPEAERIVQAVFRITRETIKKQFLTLQCLQVIPKMYVMVIFDTDRRPEFSHGPQIKFTVHSLLSDYSSLHYRHIVDMVQHPRFLSINSSEP